MNNLNDREIYVVFDPNTGTVVSIHVVGLSTHIPAEAIRVTGEQYTRLIEDSRWHYDWDTNKLVYIQEEKKLNLEELREECRNRINRNVEAEIANGFSLKLTGRQIKFSCSLTDQQNITANYLGITSEDASTVEILLRGYVNANVDKASISVTANEMRTIYNAMIAHIQACRERGWARKDYVNTPERTLQELEVYITKI